MLSILQKKALRFAHKVYKLNKGWSAFHPNKSTCEAIYGLHNCGLVRINEYDQFRITQFGREQIPFI